MSENNRSTLNMLEIMNFILSKYMIEVYYNYLTTNDESFLILYNKLNLIYNKIQENTNIANYNNSSFANSNNENVLLKPFTILQNELESNNLKEQCSDFYNRLQNYAKTITNLQNQRKKIEFSNILADEIDEFKRLNCDITAKQLILSNETGFRLVDVNNKQKSLEDITNEWITEISYSKRKKESNVIFPNPKFDVTKLQNHNLNNLKSIEQYRFVLTFLKNHDENALEYTNQNNTMLNVISILAKNGISIPINKFKENIENMYIPVRPCDDNKTNESLDEMYIINEYVEKRKMAWYSKLDFMKNINRTKNKQIFAIEFAVRFIERSSQNPTWINSKLYTNLLNNNPRLYFNLAPFFINYSNAFQMLIQYTRNDNSSTNELIDKIISCLERLNYDTKKSVIFFNILLPTFEKLTINNKTVDIDLITNLVDSNLFYLLTWQIKNINNDKNETLNWLLDDSVIEGLATEIQNNNIAQNKDIIKLKKVITNEKNIVSESIVAKVFYCKYKYPRIYNFIFSFDDIRNSLDFLNQLCDNGYLSQFDKNFDEIMQNENENNIKQLINDRDSINDILETIFNNSNDIFFIPEHEFKNLKEDRIKQISENEDGIEEFFERTRITVEKARLTIINKLNANEIISFNDKFLTVEQVNNLFNKIQENISLYFLKVSKPPFDISSCIDNKGCFNLLKVMSVNDLNTINQITHNQYYNEFNSEINFETPIVNISQSVKYEKIFPNITSDVQITNEEIRQLSDLQNKIDNIDQLGNFNDKITVIEEVDKTISNIITKNTENSVPPKSIKVYNNLEEPLGDLNETSPNIVFFENFIHRYALFNIEETATNYSNQFISLFLGDILKTEEKQREQQIENERKEMQDVKNTFFQNNFLRSTYTIFDILLQYNNNDKNKEQIMTTIKDIFNDLHPNSKNICEQYIYQKLVLIMQKPINEINIDECRQIFQYIKELLQPNKKFENDFDKHLENIFAPNESYDENNVLQNYQLFLSETNSNPRLTKINQDNLILIKSVFEQKSDLAELKKMIEKKETIYICFDACIEKLNRHQNEQIETKISFIDETINLISNNMDIHNINENFIIETLTALKCELIKNSNTDINTFLNEKIEIINKNHQKLNNLKIKFNEVNNITQIANTDNFKNECIEIINGNADFTNWQFENSNQLTTLFSEENIKKIKQEINRNKIINHIIESGCKIDTINEYIDLAKQQNDNDFIEKLNDLKYSIISVKNLAEKIDIEKETYDLSKEDMLKLITVLSLNMKFKVPVQNIKILKAKISSEKLSTAGRKACLKKSSEEKEDIINKMKNTIPRLIIDVLKQNLNFLDIKELKKIYDVLLSLLSNKPKKYDEFVSELRQSLQYAIDLSNEMNNINIVVGKNKQSIPFMIWQLYKGKKQSSLLNEYISFCEKQNFDDKNKTTAFILIHFKKDFDFINNSKYNLYIPVIKSNLSYLTQINDKEKLKTILDSIVKGCQNLISNETKIENANKTLQIISKNSILLNSNKLPELIIYVNEHFKLDSLNEIIETNNNDLINAMQNKPEKTFAIWNKIKNNFSRINDTTQKNFSSVLNVKGFIDVFDQYETNKIEAMLEIATKGNLIELINLDNNIFTKTINLAQQMIKDDMSSEKKIYCYLIANSFINSNMDIKNTNELTNCAKALQSYNLNIKSGEMQILKMVEVKNFILISKKLKTIFNDDFQLNAYMKEHRAMINIIIRNPKLLDKFLKSKSDKESINGFLKEPHIVLSLLHNNIKDAATKYEFFCMTRLMSRFAGDINNNKTWFYLMESPKEYPAYLNNITLNDSDSFNNQIQFLKRLDQCETKSVKNLFCKCIYEEGFSDMTNLSDVFIKILDKLENDKPIEIENNDTNNMYNEIITFLTNQSNQKTDISNIINLISEIISEEKNAKSKNEKQIQQEKENKIFAKNYLPLSRIKNQPKIITKSSNTSIAQ